MFIHFVRRPWSRLIIVANDRDETFWQFILTSLLNKILYWHINIVFNKCTENVIIYFSLRDVSTFQRETNMSWKESNAGNRRENLENQSVLNDNRQTLVFNRKIDIYRRKRPGNMSTAICTKIRYFNPISTVTSMHR